MRLQRNLVILIVAGLYFLPLQASGGRSNGRALETRRHHVDVNQQTLNLSDFGAVGDGTTDDGPALQSALDALATQGGGTLIIPAGRFAILTPVAKDFSSVPAANLTIQGIESTTPIHVDGLGEFVTAGLNLSSELIIKAGATVDAVSLSGLDSLLIKDVGFTGTEELTSDAYVTLSLSDIRDATIRHCEFYGLASFAPAGAIVLASRSRLYITETAFLGCTVGSGSAKSSVVQNINWKHISVTESVFADYGQRSDFYGKTPGAATYSWIGIGNAAGVDNLSPRREVSIQHVFLDEGHIYGIASPGVYSTPQDSAIDLIYISRLNMNVNNLGFAGAYLFRAKRVLVSDSYFGWSTLDAIAISIAEVDEAVLDKVQCVAAADTIHADATTKKLTVINSVYQHLASSATSTKAFGTASPEEDPVQYVTQRFTEKLGREPDAAAHDYWSNRLLACGEYAQCAWLVQIALEAYLNSTPAPLFSINGRVTDENSQGLAGVAVALSGSQTVGTVTDSQGNYRFEKLPTSGVYTITPSRVHYTFASPALTITTPSGDKTANFAAIINRHSISGNVSRDGLGLDGVTVTLSGGQAGTTLTNANGDYSFTNLPAGTNYTIAVSKPHHTFPPPSASFNDLGANQTANFAGTLNRHSISGRVTNNGNGLEGVTVTLFGGQAGSTTTNANGDYSFTNLPAGANYSIAVAKTHYTFSPPSAGFSDLGSNQTANFAATLNRHSISGWVTKDGLALESVTVTLSGDQTGTTTTDANGDYSFANLPAGGNYTVTVSKSRHTFAPPSTSFNDLGSNKSMNFAATLDRHSISGRISIDGLGLEAVTVTLSGGQAGSTNTDANGDYFFTNLPAGGNYSIAVAKPHHTFAPSSVGFIDLSANQTANFAATLNRHSISGRVTKDAIGLEGTTVTLSGGQAETTTTNANGDYSFTNLPAGGNYSIAVSKTHYAFAPSSASFNDLGSNQTANFTATLNRHSISGRVTKDGTGLDAATVVLSGDQTGSTTTDANGDYSFTNLPASGTYTVVVSKSNYTFAPANMSFSNLGSHQTANFAGAFKTFTISGTTGLQGTTVTLSGGAAGTVTTGANGAFSFTVNATGTYTVTPSKANYKFTPASRSFADLSADQVANFTGEANVLLLTETGTDYAIALGSVTFNSGPFSVFTNLNFSSDQRRRLMLFAVNVKLNAGEDASAVTSEAEDAHGNVYPLQVEFVGKVDSLESITQINVRLADGLASGGEFWISIKVHNDVSNKVRVTIVP